MTQETRDHPERCFLATEGPEEGQEAGAEGCPQGRRGPGSVEDEGRAEKLPGAMPG